MSENHNHLPPTRSGGSPLSKMAEPLERRPESPRRHSYDPYLQVALTYLRRPFATWPGRLFFGCLLLMLIPCCIALLVNNHTNRLEFTPVHMMPFVFVFVFCAIHIKEQFADARSRLTPGFCRPHIAVAAIIAIFVTIALPAVVTVICRWHSIGFVALMTLLFGCIAWVVLKPSSWLVWFIAAGPFATMTDAGQNYLRQLVFGQLETQACMIWIVGILLTVVTGIRLVQMDEDTPDYRQLLQLNWNGQGNQLLRQVGTKDKRLFARLCDWLAERQMRSLSRHVGRAGASWWSQVCRWQAGMVVGERLVVAMFSSFVYMACIFGFYSGFASNSLDRTEGLVFIMSFVLTILPAATTIGTMVMRTTMIGRELALPVERKSYIRQVGIATVLAQLQFWCVLSIALLLGLLLMDVKSFTARENRC